MCTCMNKMEEKIKNMLVESKKIPNVKDFYFSSKMLSMDDGKWHLMLPFELTYIPIKVDGTKGREKTIKTNMGLTYCPFCGVKYKSEEGWQSRIKK